jgi:hypothetical protein
MATMEFPERMIADISHLHTFMDPNLVLVIRLVLELIIAIALSSLQKMENSCVREMSECLLTHLDTAYNNLDDIPWFPAAAILRIGTKWRANFGKTTFQYDLPNYIQQYKEKPPSLAHQ